MTERAILHIDMNNFYASVECMLNPELKPYPIAVCGDQEERHGIVLAKNEPAKKYGIRQAPTLVIDDGMNFETIVNVSNIRRFIDEQSAIINA